MGKNKFIAIITVFLALVLFVIFRPGDDPVLTFKIATIAATVVFIGTFLFDRYLWRVPPFASMHSIVDINGKWEGKSIDQNGLIILTELRIIQHFNDVKVKFVGDDFNSESLICKLKKENTGLFLYILYRSRPKDKVTSKKEIYFGSMIIRCDPDVLVGEFFTTKDEKYKIELYRS